MFSANSSQVSEDRLYVEDVLSTYVYTGTGATQTINNGIDLAGKGGMVWAKSRSAATSNFLFDTARGGSMALVSNTTASQVGYIGSLTAFNSSGFTLGSGTGAEVNLSGNTYASWTFRKAPKFFDVVTYTGDGSFNASRSISHNLGVKPGFILVKATDATGNWYAVAFDGTNYRRSSAASDFGVNTTNAAAGNLFGGSSYVSATDFQLGAIVPDVDATPSQRDKVNANGVTYVAYLFAHDSTSDGIIRCGSFTTDANGYANVNLGWEPQWVLYKPTSTTGSWGIADVMRGMPASTTTTGAGNTSARIFANRSDTETAETNYVCNVNSTGFTFHSGGYASSSLIYIAIRRGPMRTPTSGTSVFAPVIYTGNNAASRQITGAAFPPDLVINSLRASGGNHMTVDRLRGLVQIQTNTTNAESSSANGVDAFLMDGVTVGFNLNSGAVPETYVNHYFRRAPSFFDEVCYTGTSVNGQAITHNLGVAPQLVIVKNRGNGTQNWVAWHSSLSDPSKFLILNSTSATQTDTGGPFGPTNMGYTNSSAFTSAFFRVSADYRSNVFGDKYVAYLFASCPGVSKVGSYNGNGSSQTINCGFTNGARFVLIKGVSGYGVDSWYVWDSARGIVAGNDPYLMLNNTQAEIASNDSIDPTSSGFVVNQIGDTNINYTGTTYIYLAVA